MRQTQTKSMNPERLATKSMNPARLATKVMGRERPEAKQPRRSGREQPEEALAYTPTRDGQALVLGWSSLDGLPNILANAAKAMTGHMELSPIEYSPRRLSEYAIEEPNYATLDEDGIAAHVRALEALLPTLKATAQIQRVYASNAEAAYEVVTHALEALQNGEAIDAIKSAYAEHKAYAAENYRAYAEAEARLEAQLEEAKRHVHTTTDVARDLEELRRKVDELTAK